MAIEGGPYTIRCDVRGCVVETQRDRPEVPAGWVHVQGELICPNHEVKMIAQVSDRRSAVENREPAE